MVRTSLRLAAAVVVVVGGIAGLAVLGPVVVPTDDVDLDRNAARAATVERVNEFRASQDRSALTAAPRLDEVARNRSRGGEARANCSATILAATVETPPEDESRLADVLVRSLTENDAARERLLRRNATEVGVGFEVGEEAVDAAVVLC